MLVNQSIQMLTIVWNERRFVESKSARLAARRCLFRAANIQLRSQLKHLETQNNEIRHEINRCEHDLHKYEEKLQILDNMTQLATQSLEVYFQARMENLRAFVSEQCRIISDGIQEEADHWKEIYAMLQQKLVVPGDLRSYGGGNGLPRGVKQSPNFSRIMEEEEEEEEEDEDEEEKKTDVSMILQSRSLTPLITQSLKKARLRASRLSHDSSMIVPRKLNMSTTMNEETLTEEPESPPKANAINHVTLGDVSAIAKETEMETDVHPEDLSVSLLQFIPTSNPDDEKQQNRSIRSTISDKTFVKTSLKPILSEEEEEERENDGTLMEDSFLLDSKEKARPLLLTADQSIRLPDRRPSSQSVKEKTKIKEEKRSFHEPISNDQQTDKNRLGKPFLPSNPTFNAKSSDFIRPTIVVTNDTSRLSPIASEESDDDGGENEKEHLLPPPPPQRKTEKKSIDETSSTSSAAKRTRTSKSPIVAANPDTSVKRRTTRRTTIRLLQENQNVQLAVPPTENSTKTRYPTRYSTRLASAMITDELTVTSHHQRTSRFTSE